MQVGARIRGRQKLLAADDMPNGGIRMTYQWTVEIEGKDRPACVAETMSIAYAKNVSATEGERPIRLLRHKLPALSAATAPDQ